MEIEKSKEVISEIDPLVDVAAIQSSTEDDDTVIVKNQKKEKFRIYKNVLIVSLTFLLTFLAFVPIQNLQSSLNIGDGIGLVSLTVMYCSLIVSSLFFTPLIITYLGCKWTILSCSLAYVVYIGANFYATWWTMVPASVLVGFGAGPLWAAKCSYLTSSAIAYAKLFGKQPSNVISWFFGIFFAFFLTGHIIGYIISSLILQTPGQFEVMLSNNNTLNGTLVTGLICGAEDCPGISAVEQFTKMREPSRRSVIILLSVFIVSITAAVIPLSIFVDKIQVTGSEDRSKSIKYQMLAPLRQLKDLRMILFFPYIVTGGIYLGFIAADFTKSYVACPVGIKSVGLVLIVYAIPKCIFSLVSGKIVKFTGRRVLFSLATLISVGILITLRLWLPSKASQVAIFGLAILAGIGMSFQDTQINAFLGTVFWNNQEASFANLRSFQSLGFAISFASGHYLCVYVKVYFIISLYCISLLLYFASEFVNDKMLKNMEQNNDLKETNCN
eukprot:gene14050-15511_t